MEKMFKVAVKDKAPRISLPLLTQERLCSMLLKCIGKLVRLEKIHRCILLKASLDRAKIAIHRQEALISTQGRQQLILRNLELVSIAPYPITMEELRQEEQSRAQRVEVQRTSMDSVALQLLQQAITQVLKSQSTETSLKLTM